MDYAPSIRAYLKKNPGVTGNVIAIEGCGLSKARPGFRRVLAGMVKEGEVVADDSTRYTTYSLASGTSVKTGAVTKSVKADTKGADDVRALPTKRMEGYTPFYKDGRLHIRCPNKQEVSLKDNEHLLVVNGVPMYTVETAKDVIACISDFAQEKGYATFVVSDITSNKVIGEEKDIVLDESRILAISIRKHNKAA